ncbi:P-loop containing nucleoside triphosphate hydrolase protein [Echria macrotheca]|uniref:P-loop containing nucleoside triphosphate hydrolase protein n=1 Tax=Echria macrotheca TaxID=438768 RepID=A0AAJ0F6Q4_9PEZI|nr:P-loop containing nucleoside triphosphate hydrolase protein [Echria macrotheca]
MDFSACPDDELFGPAIQGCRDDFDFTIRFEKIFFSLIPASVFIAGSLTRALYLYTRRPVLIGGNVFRYLKLAVISVYAALNLALLVLSVVHPGRFEAFFNASAALSFVSSACMLPLSSLEHSRALRPSILLSSYLFVTLLLDIAQTRTLWLASTTAAEITFSRLFTSTVGVKAALLLLESAQKTRWVISWDIKGHSPEETAGVFSLGAYAWLNRLFRDGYKKILTLDDLFPLDSNIASEALYAEAEKYLDPSNLKDKKHGLARALFKCLAVPFLLPVAPRIALIGFTFCQPFLIETLLDYLQAPEETVSKNIGYGLIGATLLIFTGIAVSMAFYWYFVIRSVYMVRGVLASAVYKKTTEARISVSDDSAALTLMSVDIERIVKGWQALHEFWSNLIEAAVACWLLSRHLGVASVAPMVVVVLSAFVSAFTARYVGPRQKAWMDKIQKRVGLTSNVIAQMKQLKISGLASPVEDSIQAMRVDELKTGNKFRQLLVVSVTCGYIPLCLAPVITYAFASKFLDPITMFTSLSYILLLCTPLSNLLQWIPPVLAAFTCTGRIQTFLEAEARVDFRKAVSRANSEEDWDEKKRAGSNTGFKITGGNFGWETDKPTLKNIDLEIPPSRLTIVVGPIASGKSTLCKALLGESPMAQGEVLMGGGPSRKIGFCDQTPYLANSTIRENIIGFSAFDQTRYNEVVEATLLQPDLAVLPRGDETKVGSNGITLSGGQKQRVSIARALYLDAEFFVFDDVLSGLDADTEDQVFRRIFAPEGLLRRRNATVVLCTHSVRHLPAADHIVALGQEGTIVEQGNFQELLANEQYVHSLGVKDTSSNISDDGISPAEVEAAEPQVVARPAKKSVDEDAIKDQGRMLGEWAVYKHYFERIDKLSLGSFIIFGLGWGFFGNFVTIWLKFWSEDISSPSPKHSNEYYNGLYGLFEVLTITSLVLMCLVCFQVLILGSGSRLHKEALATVIRAPLKFFTSTDTGVVTNLFSQDMTLIDGELPMALVNIALILANVVGMAAVIATASPFLCVTYPFLAVVLFLLQKFYLRTSRQMRLLDLEAKSPLYSHFIDTIKGISTFRAFGWVSQSIEVNNRLVDTSQRPMYLLSMIQRWLGFALQMVVALLAFTVVILATQTRSNTAFTGASLVTLMSFGEQLVYIIVVYTMFETSIGAVSRLKSFSERVKPEDREGEDVRPGPEWPLQGGIRIENVSASYGAEDAAADSSSEKGSVSVREEPHLAVKNLSLDIATGEKVAICGRSGSGKSSVLLLLLRILDPIPSSAEGITIDGIPLHKIDRGVLRQRLIAVPQDAVFLPDGTSFKANLDPVGVSTEAECRAVLETVGLWAVVEERGGLGGGMTADTLSQGQKQLFSLARAVLRRRVRVRQREGEYGKGAANTDGGILLLDEVSSSVDQDTEREMQKVIADEFAGYTIVMVSHRLDAVMAFDRVVVMDKGELVESGKPTALVETEGSRFRELWLVGNGNGAGNVVNKG